MTTLQQQWPLIDWADQATWRPPLTQWIKPRLKRGALGRMRKRDTSGFYADDSEWSNMLATELKDDMEVVRDALADFLNKTTVRAYHGCRTEDAGSYFREGLRIHSRSDLVEQFLRLVDEHDELRLNKPRFLERVADITRDIDQGKCFVTLDARGMIDHAGHYMIYGCDTFIFFTREGYQHVLKERGTPTLIVLDIPMNWTADWEREALAEDLLREWTRLTIDADEEVIDLDFTLVFGRPLPPECVVGHSHPAVIPDPLQLMRPH